jgi:hypothetical protein
MNRWMNALAVAAVFGVALLAASPAWAGYPGSYHHHHHHSNLGISVGFGGLGYGGLGYGGVGYGVPVYRYPVYGYGVPAYGYPGYGYGAYTSPYPVVAPAQAFGFGP